MVLLGTPVCTIIDEFLEKFQKGGRVISDPKNFVAKFLALETPIWGGHFRSKKFRRRKSQDFSQRKGGGQGPFGTFPKIHRYWYRRASHSGATYPLLGNIMIYWLWILSNISGELSWLLPILASDEHIKCQIFVNDKETEDLIGESLETRD